MNVDNLNIWIIITIMLVLVILVLYSLYIVYKYTKPISTSNINIPKFSTSIHWDPYPVDVEIENTRDCNASNLQICKIDDPTTLFGCKELSVKCHHFDKNIRYFDKSKEYIIKKNDNKNEGYALSITTLSENCNPYHGDLTLISKNIDSNEYMLICNCKQPGYIGNDNILKSCETVYICDGHIDDINKSLSEINCICDVGFKSVRYSDGLPVCKPLLIKEANEKYKDWSDLIPWQHDRTIDPNNVYDKTITGNLNIKKLLHPCKNALDDPIREIPLGEYFSSTKTCHFKNYGIPVRTGLLEKFDNSKFTKQQAPLETIDNAIYSTKYKWIRQSDQISNKRLIGNVRTSILEKHYNTKIDSSTTLIHNDDDTLKELSINLPLNCGFGSDAHIELSPRKEIYAGRCTGSWPTYDCALKNYFNDVIDGIPTSGHRKPPSTFLWGTDDWNSAENMIHLGTRINTGLVLDHSYFNKSHKAQNYGMVYCSDSISSEECTTGPLSFVDYADYKIHNDALTPLKWNK